MTNQASSIEYVKVTGSNVVLKTDIPKIISYNGQLVSLPECLRRKQDFVRVNSSGKTIACSHIHKGLGNALNALTLDDDAKLNELDRAIDAIHNEVSKLVKDKLLKGKSRRGAMAFSQSSESVPKNSIVISKATYDLLCEDNEKWKRTSRVFCVRFPNLGPRTTVSLRLIVDTDPIETIGTISERPGVGSTLRTLLEEFGIQEETKTPFGAIFMNPANLKGDLEGDGDGDTVYIAPLQRGNPSFQKIDWRLQPADVDPNMVETMFRKADRTERNDISTYICQYFDTPMIGPATYGIRWTLKKASLPFGSEKQPWHNGWKLIAPWAIRMAETVFDRRKGDSDTNEVERVFDEIENLSYEIKDAQESGDWYAKVITNNSVQDPDLFLQDFSNLESFVKHIQGKDN